MSSSVARRSPRIDAGRPIRYHLVVKVRRHRLDLLHGSTPVQPVLNVASYAAEIGEPRQIREEAAVSRHLWVTWGCAAGAGCTGVFLCIDEEPLLRP